MALDYEIVTVAAGTAKLVVERVPGAGPSGEDVDIPAVVEVPNQTTTKSHLTVGTTPILLTPSVLARRKWLFVQNNGTDDIGIVDGTGGGNTMADAVPIIRPGGSWDQKAGPNIIFYVLAASAGQDVGVRQLA